MSVRYEEYKGEKILILDYTGLRGQDFLDAIDEAEKEILKYKPGTVSTITNVTNTYIVEEIKERFTELSNKTKGKTKISTVIGVVGIKKIIARIIKKDLYYASSEMDAKEYIVNNV